MINYDDWEEYRGISEGSGRSEKIWLRRGAETGLFKFPKSTETTEMVSERLAYTMGKVLGIECAHVEIGTRDGRIGCMSYLVIAKDEIMVEGVNFISHTFPNYDPDSMIDRDSQEYYSLKFILQSAGGLIPIKFWIEMLLFDFLLGNTDRHQSNWAITVDEKFKFTENSPYRSPLYDNGSSLCAYVQEEQIDAYLGADKNRFRALTDSKSTSRVRIDSSIKKEPRHKEVVRYLLKQYPRDTIELANRIVGGMSEEIVNGLLVEFPCIIVSVKKKKLIVQYLLEKVAILKQLLDGG